MSLRCRPPTGRGRGSLGPRHSAGRSWRTPAWLSPEHVFGWFWLPAIKWCRVAEGPGLSAVGGQGAGLEEVSPVRVRRQDADRGGRGKTEPAVDPGSPSRHTTASSRPAAQAGRLSDPASTAPAPWTPSHDTAPPRRCLTPGLGPPQLPGSFDLRWPKLMQRLAARRQERASQLAGLYRNSRSSCAQPHAAAIRCAQDCAAARSGSSNTANPPVMLTSG